MMATTKNMLMLASMALMCQLASSLECFVCNSIVDSNCETTSGEIHLYNCTDKAFPEGLPPEGGLEVGATESPENGDGKMEKVVKRETHDVTKLNYTDDGKPILEDYNLCKKAYQIIHDKVRVFRSCGWLNSKKDCYYTASLGVQNTVCQCQEDRCNSAPTNTIANIAMTLFITLLSIFIIHI